MFVNAKYSVNVEYTRIKYYCRMLLKKNFYPFRAEYNNHFPVWRKEFLEIKIFF